MVSKVKPYQDVTMHSYRILCDYNDYSHRPRVPTTHNIRSIMACTTQILTTDFHCTDVQFLLSSAVMLLKTMIHMNDAVLTCDKRDS